MNKINDFNFNNTRALIRVDFNVPLDNEYNISDTTRIDKSLSTINKILKDGGSVVLMSHLGRPKKGLQSVALGAEEKFSLKHIVPYLSKKLNTPIIFEDDAASEKAFNTTKNLKNGEVVLLENLRFYPEEEMGDEDFADMLSQHGQVYVNDAFGTAHRAHASTSIIAHYFKPEHKFMGYLMAAEVDNAYKILNDTKHPFTAILGGAKVSDKIEIINNLINKADNILIGGGMAYTFFKAKGGNIGKSLVEDDKLDMALDLLEKAKKNNVKIVLPEDSIIADDFNNDANTKTANNMEIPEGWMGLDIGSKAQKDFAQIIENSATILWNGPMGVFEMNKFQEGTKTIAKAVAKATKNGAFSLIGGGDSVAAINKFDLADQVSYVSTGGGALLELFEGKNLPGIEALI
ncbi:MAG: phosphoglycerate kinase [Chitinophagales bacterium]|nr:phosphoglycerate kinase [Chitinophagales bacterium]